MEPTVTPYRLEVRPSIIAGRGCFALEPIPIGARLGEYTGELIDAAETRRREADPSRPILLTFEVDQNWTIDGMFGGNITTFINHSCDPNCSVAVDTVERRVFFHARRNIAAGEELTIDYAFDPNDPLEPCHCGAPNCRGYMNDIAPG